MLPIAYDFPGLETMKVSFCFILLKQAWKVLGLLSKKSSLSAMTYYYL